MIVRPGPRKTSLWRRRWYILTFRLDLWKAFAHPFDRQLKNGKRGFKMGQLDGEKLFSYYRKNVIDKSIIKINVKIVKLIAPDPLVRIKWERVSFFNRKGILK